MKRNPESVLGRREFLQRSAAALGAVSLGVGNEGRATEDAAPSIRRAVKLGATDLEISDIGLGTSALRDADLVVESFVGLDPQSLVDHFSRD
ncbi:MAG: twin-arginine translocation signal domain-containing protein [Proteobacteria bacterium]|nr:twin-arginine translocation signal domain-containing protein [Pseudomonadota bacterium]